MANIVLDYQPYTPEEAQSAKAQADADSQNGIYAPKFRNGKTSFRFLPRLGNAPPFYQVSQHFVETSEGKKWSFNCLRVMTKQPCPMCQLAEKLRASGNYADTNKAKQCFPKMRWFANVIQRDIEERGVLILGFGKSIMDALTDIMTEQGIDVTDPRANGRDIDIKRTGQGAMDTEYHVLANLKTRPLAATPEETAHFLASRHNLKGMCGEILPYDIIAEAIASDTFPDRKAVAAFAAPPKAPKQIGKPKVVSYSAEDDAELG